MRESSEKSAQKKSKEVIEKAKVTAEEKDRKTVAEQEKDPEVKPEEVKKTAIAEDVIPGISDASSSITKGTAKSTQSEPDEVKKTAIAEDDIPGIADASSITKGTAKSTQSEPDEVKKTAIAEDDIPGIADASSITKGTAKSTQSKPDEVKKTAIAEDDIPGIADVSSSMTEGTANSTQSEPEEIKKTAIAEDDIPGIADASSSMTKETANPTQSQPEEIKKAAIAEDDIPDIADASSSMTEGTAKSTQLEPEEIKKTVIAEEVLPNIADASSSMTEGTAKSTQSEPEEELAKEQLSSSEEKERESVTYYNKLFSAEKKTEGGFVAEKMKVEGAAPKHEKVKSKVNNQKSGLKVTELFILPALLAIVSILILSAIFTGDSHDVTAELETHRGTMKNGKVVNKDWFTVEVSEINGKMARQYNIPSNTNGVVIVEVEGTRDVKRKLQEGDVISGINGKRIKNVRDFRKASQNFNPDVGLFLDINRHGYPIYIPIQGTNFASNSQSVQYQNPPPFEITEVAPFLGKDIDVGGIDMQTGAIGKEIETWINNNSGSGYYACLTCGTIIPHNNSTKNKVVLCPKCRTSMVSQLPANVPTAFYQNNRNNNSNFKRSLNATAPPITSNAIISHEYRGVCSKCHQIIDRPTVRK